MAIPTVESNIHWNYFLALEQDLEKISRYIEFHGNNYETYSIELAHLLLAASSEVDVILKMICKEFGGQPNLSRGNIDEYRKVIKRDFPRLLEIKCEIPRFNIPLNPWQKWIDTENQNPGWWRSYNKVKHQRNECFSQANLKNTLNALSALSIVILFYNYLKKKKFST